MRRILTVMAAAAAAGLLAATVPAAVADDGVSRECRFTDERFIEISGMTYSQLHPDVIWLHNDSGGGPYIYAVDATTCRTLAQVTIAGIDARDIEAIASGRDRKGRPVLWIGDLGDNLNSWPEVRLHRIREPRALVDQTVTARTYRVAYRDRPHDAETLLADPNSTRVWIVTKQLAHGRLYELPERMSTTALNIARPVHREGGLITDGSVSPDGSRYVLRDYVDARVLAGLPQGTPAETIVLPFQPQGEAVTWTTDGQALLVASERDDRLLRVSVGPLVAAAASPALVAPAATNPAPNTAAPNTAAPEAATARDEASSVSLSVVAAGAAAALLVAACGLAIARRRRARAE